MKRTGQGARNNHQGIETQLSKRQKVGADRSSETAHIEIITLVFMLNSFQADYTLHSQKDLKLILMHAGYYKINTYAYRNKRASIVQQ